MVAVEPLDLRLGEERRVDERRLYRHVRELREPQVLPLVERLAPHARHLRPPRDEQVLDADAEGALLVVSRLVGDDHPLLQADGVGVPRRDGVRPLVHVERGADAVPRAVEVVEPRLPQREARERIERRAGGVLREDGGVERDVPLEDPREALDLPARRRAEVEGARDVGRAALVLPAGVEQHELRAVEARGARGVQRVVVDDRAVGPDAGDGGEGEVEEARLRRAELGEARGELRLRDGAALDGDGLLEPREEVRERGAVDEMRLQHARQLRLVLTRLGHRDR
mmetsp:Transcript_32340/g.78524  ORF Transcript_32340/g.78524 Transcript_32340/m.78524 type:complete len:284 (-) Transcript_32340:1139-1990(-)